MWRCKVSLTLGKWFQYLDVLTAFQPVGYNLMKLFHVSSKLMIISLLCIFITNFNKSSAMLEVLEYTWFSFYCGFVNTIILWFHSKKMEKSYEPNYLMTKISKQFILACVLRKVFKTGAAEFLVMELFQLQLLSVGLYNRLL